MCSHRCVKISAVYLASSLVTTLRSACRNKKAFYFFKMNLIVRPSNPDFEWCVHWHPHEIFLQFHDLWTLLNKIREGVALSSLSILHKPTDMQISCRHYLKFYFFSHLSNFLYYLRELGPNVTKVQKYFMRTRMHGTPTGRPDYQFIIHLSRLLTVDTLTFCQEYSQGV